MEDKKIKDEKVKDEKIKNEMIIEKEDQVVTVEEGFDVDTTEGDDAITIACLVKS
ncbi:hypothetical protein [Clostridium tunisiense]|uniref:hypothetical protein n=1 Tax=Clostridium tunisiense TaxID=219748 RepID=UPI000309606F|nr:hypothetical protein [Clostridium tunisiense]